MFTLFVIFMVVAAGAGVYLYLKKRQQASTGSTSETAPNTPTNIESDSVVDNTPTVPPAKTSEEELKAAAKAAADENAARTAVRLASEAEAKARAKFTITAERVGSKARVTHPRGEISTNGNIIFQFVVPWSSTDKWGNVFDMTEWKTAGGITVQGGTTDKATYIFDVFNNTTAVRVVAPDGSMAEAPISKK